MRQDGQFHSLEDFLASTLSHVDGILDDGWGSGFPVKGREIEATVLFADISGFSTRTLAMSPAATLVYVRTSSPGSPPKRSAVGPASSTSTSAMR